MLIRFIVKNFKYFDKKQELAMIPYKKLQKNKERIIELNKLLGPKEDTIYDSCDSGNVTRQGIVTSSLDYINMLIEDEVKRRNKINKIKTYAKDINTNLFIACDNTTGNCWVEEFESLQDCIDYLNGEEILHL